MPGTDLGVNFRNQVGLTPKHLHLTAMQSRAGGDGGAEESAYIGLPSSLRCRKGNVFSRSLEFVTSHFKPVLRGAFCL